MKKGKRTDKPGGDKPGDSDSEKDIDLTDLDPVSLNADLGAGPLTKQEDGQVRIFGKYTEAEITELMEWSEIFTALKAKGYNNFRLELQYLSDMDQRIFVKEDDDVLIHIRLKLSDFRFRLHAGAPTRKLLYIDWLLTQHPKSKRIRPERLFPGQELPGLGIFSQISDFITNLGLGVNARGAFNIPEYFHDALLFHRQFYFYDPVREALFRALIRDLSRYGARRISRALADGRVRDARGESITWKPGEMISPLTPELEEMLWDPEYHTRVVRGLKGYKFTMMDD